MRRLAMTAAAVAVAGGAPVTTVNLLDGATTSATATTTVTKPEAARFLTQASFGPTDASIGDVQTSGIDAWINQQESMSLSQSSQTFLTNRLAAEQLINPSVQLAPRDFYDSFWKEAVTAPDQLRQRVKLALSEIRSEERRV